MPELPTGGVGTILLRSSHLKMNKFDNFSSSIFEEMENLFSDSSKFRGPLFFKKWIAEPLKQLIEDVASKKVEVNQSTVKKFATRYYATGQFQTKEQKEDWKEIMWIFAMCGVLIRSKSIDSECELEPLFRIFNLPSCPLFWTSIDTLLAKYPEFWDLPDEELILLLRFRNMVHAAVQVIKPKDNKQLILYIAGHLEGSGNRYITGSDMNDKVRRRVLVYEREGNQSYVPRPKRRKSTASVSSPDNSISVVSVRSVSLGADPSLDGFDEDDFSLDSLDFQAEKRRRCGEWNV